MKTANNVEEVSAEEIEVIDTTENKDDPIISISADDPLPNTAENPLGKIMENMEELKKIRAFGFVALMLSFIAIMVKPVILGTIAVGLALLDLWKGSKFTRKISLVAVVLAGLAILNSWT